MKRLALAIAAVSLTAFAPAKKPGTAEAVAAAQPADWRRVDPANTLYMEVNGGTVIIELAPQFAPLHVDNIKTLVKERFFDGTSINRVQENYVTQWGDGTEKKSLGTAKATLPLEAERSAKGLAFTRLNHRDAYARQVGFVDGFQAASDGKGRAWMAQCYGVVGVGRGESTESGSGAELYTMIGQAPRHLDRNYAGVGRILQGMELMTALPRGTGQLGFYEQESQRVPIKRVRLGTDVPAAERIDLEVMRTDGKAFATFVDARANRERDGFMIGMRGVDLCNIRVPVRPAAK
ncbi:peptidylprolyl isomerase [Sphingoaurantiacus capsulatus]|uniref:peptidylprolyl isomerase n=1 Tax=Sphingoaurantiacus capsulatus TaxID=1771310 RepID=A0ABV7XHB2_9SPHN